MNFHSDLNGREGSIDKIEIPFSSLEEEMVETPLLRDLFDRGGSGSNNIHRLNFKMKVSIFVVHTIDVNLNLFLAKKNFFFQKLVKTFLFLDDDEMILLKLIRD